MLLPYLCLKETHSDNSLRFCELGNTEEKLSCSSVGVIVTVCLLLPSVFTSWPHALCVAGRS